MSEKAIPLTEWIHTFHSLVDKQQQSRKLQPDSLIPALRLGWSLTAEICKIEKEFGRMPMPRKNWIDNIVVYSQSNIPEGAFSGNESSVDDGFIRVEISPHLFDERDEDARVVDGILYSLGVVFYQIFSGGDRPVELESKQTIGDTLNDIETWTEELSEGFNPFNEDRIIDFDEESCMYENLLSGYNFSDDYSTPYYVSFQGRCPRKKQSLNRNFNMCSISVEPLKEKGLPQPLCDLITNMLVSTNGQICNDGVYHEIFEVRDDLRFILDKPSISLHEQDLGMLSTDWEFGSNTLFDRRAELFTIKKVFQRAVTGDSEVVTIIGHSGTGKSRLAHEFIRYVIEAGGIVLSGKFDQLQRGKPFSALASAFNEYCGLFLNSNALASLKQKFAHQIKHVLGRDVCHLVKLIPNLANIVGHEKEDCMKNNQSCTNAQKRINYLMCLFVEVISSTFATPVTMFLDDLQWADTASVEAVNQILLSGGLASDNTHFFFLGCYREGDPTSCQSPWKKICDDNLINAKSTSVKLDCMSEDTLNKMISETLGLLPSHARSFSSVIHHKTKGNPLFVFQLLSALKKDDLLWPSLSERRWKWDLERIQRQKISDDVAIFLTSSIEALSVDVKSCICVISCFGSSADIAFVKLLEKSLETNLLENLDVAVKEGLLDMRDDRYYFTHDRIQEAAYTMMNDHDRCRIHFEYGMALAPFEEDYDGILLTAVNQLNLAGPDAAQDRSQYVIAADLNLRAGKKSMEMSDFAAAYAYFDRGISFLRKKHWVMHYSLSLELFDFAAKCAVTNGDIVSVRLLYEQVMVFGKSFEDKLKVMYCNTCSLAFSSRLPESIEMGLDILEKLGIQVRGHDSNVEACVQKTKDLLSTYTDDEILNSSQMTDSNMIIAMKFLGKLEVGMTQIMPKSVPFVTQQIIQLSLSHGMSPVSPLGFVHLGSYIAKLGNIREGYHYVRLALSLIDRVEFRESAGEVICLGTLVRAYVEPLQASLDYHHEGYTASMVSGDVIQAALNRFLHCSSSFFAGMKLQDAQEKCTEVTTFLHEKQMFIFVIQLQCLQNSVFKLVGYDGEPKYDVAEEETILRTNNCVMTSFYFHKAYASFIFRSYDDAEYYAENHLSSIGSTWANLVVAHAFHAFYIGLISFWLARKSKDGQLWYERGEEKKIAMKKWAETSQWTFENKWFLLEAEESYCNKDFDVAELLYEKAISSAKEHKVRLSNWNTCML